MPGKIRVSSYLACVREGSFPENAELQKQLSQRDPNQYGPEPFVRDPRDPQGDSRPWELETVPFSR